jgi:hypothetical protein
MLVLFFVSVTALWGGAVLVAEAHGNPWGMLPVELLHRSPFHSWLIPGIILFSAIGLLAFWTLWLALRQRMHHGLWLSFQGFVLLVWLFVECLFLRMVIWPHYFYGALGLFLVLSGFVLNRASVPQAATS